MSKQTRLILILVATLGAAFALKAGLLAFAMYALLGLVLTSRYLAKSWIENLEAVRELNTDESFEVGDSVTVKVRLKNRGTLFIAWVLAEDLLPDWAFRQKPARMKVDGKRLRLSMIRGGKTLLIKYSLQLQQRGYYQIGPMILETGDLFGLHRRYRIVAGTKYLLVLPKILPLPKYDFASSRPVGEVALACRLFEDPTRNAGVRPYQIGDPLQRVHWRATARTGELQCRVYDPTSLSGASFVLDLHESSYSKQKEPFRSDLAVTTIASLAYSLTESNQKISLFSNGRDAAERLQQQAFHDNDDARESIRDGLRMDAELDQLRPTIVEPGRGPEVFHRIRELLARLEVTDGLNFQKLLMEIVPRLPRDATVLAILGGVSLEAAIALGTLRRQGFAVSAVIVGLRDDPLGLATARLAAEGIRDIRAVPDEESLPALGGADSYTGGEATPYEVAYLMT
jgi:uncharacterized protein (DUF58 family)